MSSKRLTSSSQDSVSRMKSRADSIQALADSLLQTSIEREADSVTVAYEEDCLDNTTIATRLFLQAPLRVL